ncbi:MAG: hypothetical protein ACYCSF_06660 [Acidimicrobiales bacterium]
MAALLSPWGFELSAIAVPVVLWHGELDTAAPSSHRRWLAARVPDVEAPFAISEDHASIEAACRQEPAAGSESEYDATWATDNPPGKLQAPVLNVPETFEHRVYSQVSEL